MFDKLGNQLKELAKPQGPSEDRGKVPLHIAQSILSPESLAHWHATGLLKEAKGIPPIDATSVVLDVAIES